MELRQLSHFLAVLDAGSITAAAIRVGVTQQALSKSLARLEEDMGGRLFEREARGMVPTRLGEAIAEHARQTIANAGRLRNAARAELGLQRGRLIVGLSPIAAASSLGRRVTRFSEANPTIRIDVEGGIDTDFVAMLNHGELDIALSSQLGAETEGILLEPLQHERWGVAGCISNRLLAEARTLADLADARWILGRNTALLDDRIAASFVDAGLGVPRPGIMTTSVLFSLHALRFSRYLTILPHSLCQDMPELLWRDLADGLWQTPIYLMRRKRAHMDDLTRALLAALAD
ncbi:LysR family transcriptional regulator [Sandaracinobacteroides sp. A072]|uniref:LysR family transcriptional regulator n=1 Tax=Sandaracinobacteroides sp. A072 TaxID=3461146 RepID=UPI00404203A7